MNELAVRERGKRRDEGDRPRGEERRGEESLAEGVD